MQGRPARQARSLLPGQLHPKGQEQYQVRKEGGPGDSAQAAQELRTHEALDGEVDRPGYGIVSTSADQKTDGMTGRTCHCPE